MYASTKVSGVVFDVEIETSTPRLQKASITIGDECVDFTQLFLDNDIDEFILDKYHKEIKQINHNEEREAKEYGNGV